MLYLKHISQINKKCRIVIKLVTYEDKEHGKNSIIKMIKLNDRTWDQTIKNR